MSRRFAFRLALLRAHRRRSRRYPGQLRRATRQVLSKNLHSQHCARKQSGRATVLSCSVEIDPIDLPGLGSPSKLCGRHVANRIASLAMGILARTASPDIVLWNEGYQAARRGAFWSANPYPLGSVRNLAWHAGFTEGSTQRLKQVACKEPKYPRTCRSGNPLHHRL